MIFSRRAVKRAVLVEMLKEKSENHRKHASAPSEHRCLLAETDGTAVRTPEAFENTCEVLPTWAETICNWETRALLRDHFFLDRLKFLV